MSVCNITKTFFFRFVSYNKHVIKMLMKVHLACLATVWFRIILRVHKPISTYYTVIANVRTASCYNYFADETVISVIYYTIMDD